MDWIVILVMVLVEPSPVHHTAKVGDVVHSGLVGSAAKREDCEKVGRSMRDRLEEISRGSVKVFFSCEAISDDLASDIRRSQNWQRVTPEQEL